jgi:hypothetical protein
MVAGKESAICEGCLRTSDSKNLDVTNFHWVFRTISCSLFCDDCIEKGHMEIDHPYSKTKKKKKKE